MSVPMIKYKFQCSNLKVEKSKCDSTLFVQNVAQQKSGLCLIGYWTVDYKKKG